ncbi:MAG: DUF3791 domain-containing protein [Oscillospiraceae bacterium]|jgi:hypothetical protein|nr:DUF3791 domain-containing protein [Oscillospiraceae bacterium]
MSSEKLVKWWIFCIYLAASEFKVLESTVYAWFTEYGIFEYTEENYETLHTQSAEFVLGSILEKLRRNGFSEVPL